ncbi:MAG: SEC-C metal-binding domain-containing protein, partial [Bacteroidota bacterium]|nr:SEC-C metal-binding domain-containing protein [Bacteroidota bacterium]
GYQEDNEASNFYTPQQTDSNKVGRNELCPCGSGKKYKKCCLQN